MLRETIDEARVILMATETEQWVGLFVTASAKEIAAALRQGRPTH